jgi:hypothetical protein
MMEASKNRLQPATVLIDGLPLGEVRGVRLDCRTLEIHLLERATIKVYVFSSLMLPIASKRLGRETYIFDGPRLGIYHDTADVREGPFINHFIHHLEIAIAYPSEHEAAFDIKGTADLAESYMDSYWYKGPRSGTWTFEAAFLRPFSQ